MAVERRQFPRASIMCKISTIFGERLLVFHSHTENVGVGGVRVILEEKLHIATEVRVELFLHHRDNPLTCKGQVAWVREMLPVGTVPRLFDTGIKFTDVPEAEQEELKKLVNSLISEGR